MRATPKTGVILFWSGPRADAKPYTDLFLKEDSVWNLIPCKEKAWSSVGLMLNRLIGQESSSWTLISCSLHSFIISSCPCRHSGHS
jgi:hypothetical protein